MGIRPLGLFTKSLSRPRGLSDFFQHDLCVPVSASFNAAASFIVVLASVREYTSGGVQQFTLPAFLLNKFLGLTYAHPGHAVQLSRSLSLSLSLARVWGQRVQRLKSPAAKYMPGTS